MSGYGRSSLSIKTTVHNYWRCPARPDAGLLLTPSCGHGPHEPVREVRTVELVLGHDPHADNAASYYAPAAPLEDEGSPLE